MWGVIVMSELKTFKGNDGDLEVRCGDVDTQPIHIAGIFSDREYISAVLSYSQGLELKERVRLYGGATTLGKTGVTEHHPLSEDRTVVTVGLGESSDFGPNSKVPGHELMERIRRGVGSGIKDAATLLKRSGREAGVSITCLGIPGKISNDEYVGATIDAAIRSGFVGNKAFVGMEPGKRITGIRVLDCGLASPESIATVGEAAVAENKARRLFEEPHNVVTPTYLMESFLDMAILHSGNGMKVKVNFGRTTILAHAEENALAGLASVALASPQAHFVHISYNGNPGDSRRFALLGKGITFDSGGMSIKPSEGMDEMDGDMGGAATVYGTLEGLARIHVPINIDAYVSITENNIGPEGSKPGRRLDYGKDHTEKPFPKVYVANTDAEGRLVLSTAAAFADRKDVEAMISFSTLTGAMVLATGAYYTGGIIANAHDPVVDPIVKAFLEAGDRTYELFQHFRPVPGQEDRIKDPRGGIRNLGGPGKWGGAFDGYHFVNAFTSGVPYVHVDMAPALEAVSDQTYLNSRFGAPPVMATILALSKLVKERTDKI